MDDDTRNMNLNQDSQERNDDEGERGPDVTEEEAVIANSCIQALKELVTKADTEIDELEKDLVFLQIELASAGREHWLNEFYNALGHYVDLQEMALVCLRNNIISPSPNEAEPKKLHVILNALMARLSGSGMATNEFHEPHVTPPSALSIHQYPEARQLLLTMDDDTRNMNLNQDSQERNDDEGESRPDVTEEEAVTAKSSIQALKELVTKADTEIDELEKDLVFLQIKLASAGCEHWLNEFYNALRNHVDWLEMALVGLRNNIMSPNEARRRLYREPAKKLHVILNALMARLSGSGMATDEFHNPHVTPSVPSAHQYPEMIMAAIEALNEPNGSNKTTILKHLESTYGKLPAAHSTLLSNHLTKLKNSGQLVFFRNNYMKPDPNAPPQRGRGRPPKPPKPKNPLTSAVAVSYESPRTRSRTPKARDPFAPVSQPKKVSAGSSRPHGRPRKDKPEGTSSPPAGEPEISREKKILTRRRTWRPLSDFYRES